MEFPASLSEVQDAVISLARVRVTGGGSKPALSAGANLSVAKLSGIIEYNPSEYTFTAFAGTPLAEIRDELAKNGQALPFDPPFVEAGGTLGGTVAAGLSGPGRFRYGGARDFFLGARLVTGEGRVVFGGGKVVKNAAGFDIPKLMVGGLGSLGVLVELTFKVFPQPATFVTVRADFPDVRTADDAMTRLAMSQCEVTCLDLESPHRVWVRIGGLSEATEARIERVQSILGSSSVTVLRDAEDAQVWSDAREFRWIPAAHSLIKIAISPAQVRDIEDFATRQSVPFLRRYSVGGNVAWLAWPDAASRTELDALCAQLKRSALALTGTWDSPFRGAVLGGAFRERLLSVFDPAAKLAVS